jgi:hypothetical protein
MVFRQRYRSKAGLILIILSDDGLPAPNAAALAMALERAAAAVARLDMALAGHPLAAAWAYRARLDAVHRQAAADGMMIDPWHLAALVEGVRLRLDPGARLSDRGAILDAARHALALYQWSSRPDNAQQAAISAATAHLTMVADNHSPLLGAAHAIHAWLDQGGERPPMRAALARYWVDRGVTARPCPLLTGADALAAAVPWTRDLWIRHFLDAVATEAADGLALLRLIERSWGHARHAVAGRRRDSHAAAAIDLLAAAPLLSATALAQLLGIAIKNTLRLLDGLVVQGLASEVTHRSKRRLYAWLPVPGQQFVDPVGGMLGNSAQHVSQPGLWIDVIHFAVVMRLYMAAARCPPRCQRAVLHQGQKGPAQIVWLCHWARSIYCFQRHGANLAGRPTASNELSQYF